MESARKKRIGIDFDDTLIDFNGGIATFHNQHYGTSYSRDHITSYNYFQEMWGCSKDEALRRMEEYVHSDHHTVASPLPGAVEAVRYLKENGHQLFLITARGEELKHHTSTLLDIHFPESFESLHFLYRNNENVLGTKGDVGLQLEVDIIIDDSLANAIDISKTAITTLLLDTPWNQSNELPENVIRVSSWEEILKEIER